MSNSSNTSLISELVTATFSGLSAAGAITISGLAVGDVIVTGTVNGLPLWNSFAPFFESVVSVAGELQQLSGDMVGPTFVIYLIRPIL